MRTLTIIVHVVGSLLLLSPNTAGAQPTVMVHSASTTQHRNTIDLLCHRWMVNLEQVAGEAKCFPAESMTTVEFRSDGSLVLQGQRKLHGAWQFDKARNELLIVCNGSSWKYNLLSLSESVLVLGSKAGKKITKTYLWRTML